MIDYGFIRIAAASPPVRVGDVDYNTSRIIDFARRAEKSGADAVLFPELSITGYTVGDLLFQRILLDKAVQALKVLKKYTRGPGPVLIVGFPLRHDGKLFNAAAVISGGRILGIVPKTHIPGYKEFYEERWFASSRDLITNEAFFLGEKIPVGTDVLFRFAAAPDAVFGIEICEDVWTAIPPSSRHALSGAGMTFNLSASPELVEKAEYRRDLIAQQSARTVSAYVYASAGVHESTTDLVFGGQCIIAENGAILSESRRFRREGDMIISDIDIEHITHDREKMTSFGETANGEKVKNFRIIDVRHTNRKKTGFFRFSDGHPFVPGEAALRSGRSEEIFSIQIAGLAKRLEYARMKKAVIGVSGGLDSTLALLVAAKTFALLGYPMKNIHAYTMPGFGTSKRTKSNAHALCASLGIALEEIDITKTVTAHFRDIRHDSKKQDVVFENAQARYRTMILMDKANQIGALLVGTGDLSELALGWNTFSGDQISHYNVNAGVPKTLVAYLVDWVRETQVDEKTAVVLKDVLDTPISPELLKSRPSRQRSGLESGGPSQKTEEIIGPYELHDFFLYHFLRWGTRPKKILFLAEHAFGKKYSRGSIKKWLRVFLERFFANQWKRSVMPDGPKVGSVALSPRGDWRMPSDAEVKMWIEDLG